MTEYEKVTIAISILTLGVVLLATFCIPYRIMISQICAICPKVGLGIIKI